MTEDNKNENAVNQLMRNDAQSFAGLDYDNNNDSNASQAQIQRNSASTSNNADATGVENVRYDTQVEKPLQKSQQTESHPLNKFNEFTAKRIAEIEAKRAKRPQEERKRKIANAIAGISDVARAFANLHYTTQYAPSVNTSQSYSKVANERYEKMKQKWEDEDKEYINHALNKARWRWRADEAKRKEDADNQDYEYKKELHPYELFKAREEARKKTADADKAQTDSDNAQGLADAKKDALTAQANANRTRAGANNALAKKYSQQAKNEKQKGEKPAIGRVAGRVFYQGEEDLFNQYTQEVARDLGIPTETPTMVIRNDLGEARISKKARPKTAVELAGEIETQLYKNPSRVNDLTRNYGNDYDYDDTMPSQRR